MTNNLNKVDITRLQVKFSAVKRIIALVKLCQKKKRPESHN